MSESKLNNIIKMQQQQQQQRIASSATSTSSSKSKLVDSFQELNARLSAFDRLSQLKTMVLEGKLKQDVFEEMYRINTEKLVEKKSKKKFASSSSSSGDLHDVRAADYCLLEDFPVKHHHCLHSTSQQHSTSSSMEPLINAKVKRMSLFFDRIVLTSSITFGMTQKETIPISHKNQMCVYEEDNRVDVVSEEKEDEFLFESDRDRKLFVKALEKVLETAYRSEKCKDEPVLLNRPIRTESQIERDANARRKACAILQKSASSNDEQKDECDTESIELATTTSSISLLNISQRTLNKGEDDVDDEGNDNTEAEIEKTNLSLQQAMIDREKALEALENAKSKALDARFAEAEQTKKLERAKEAEEALIALAVRTRDEDLKCAQRVAECVAVEIAAKNALENDDLASVVTQEGNQDDEGFYMSDDLRALIGRNQNQRQTSVSSNASTTTPGSPRSKPSTKLQYALKVARKRLADARENADKVSQQRRAAEVARKEARLAVTEESTNCVRATKKVTLAEEKVLTLKSSLTRIDDRIEHYKHRLLILERHRDKKSSANKKAEAAADKKETFVIPEPTDAIKLRSPSGMVWQRAFIEGGLIT